MSETEFDLQSHLATKGRLDYVPGAAKHTLILVPGWNQKAIERGDDTTVLFVDSVIQDALLDDIPYEQYPFIPPIIFGWGEISAKVRSQIGFHLEHSDVVYDEFHKLAVKDCSESDMHFSRMLAWYLITRAQGDRMIAAKLRKFDGVEADADVSSQLMASELVDATALATTTFRNAYLNNFNMIGMRIVKAFMRREKPGTLSFKANFKEDIASQAGWFADYAYRTPKSWDVWTSHDTWLPVLLEFSKSTAAQRAVAFSELTTAKAFGRTKISLGTRIIGGVYADFDRNILYRPYVGEPLVDMIARGFIDLDFANRTLTLTDRGEQVAEAFRPLEDLLHSGHFMDRNGLITPGKSDEASGWILDLFSRMKTIADNLTNDSEAAE